METLFNCVWLVLGLSLITAWTILAYRTREYAPHQFLPSRQLQFTALLLLVILLFPVISLTDDLAMCTAPPDAERALRLHDSFDCSQPVHSLLPSTMAWMSAIAAMIHEGSRRSVEPDAERNTLLDGTPLPLDSRPPPATL